MRQKQPPLHYRTYELGRDHDWVVFVHGAGGSSTIWFKQIREYRRHYNVLMVDLRGHGQSASLREAVQNSSYSFEDVSGEIIDVMDHLDIQSAHFVGVSLGSVLIRTIAEMQPQRVLSMVLGGAVTRLNFRSRFLVALGNLFKRVVPYMWLYRFFAWIIMPRANHKESRLLFVTEAKKLCQREFIRWFRLTYEINPLLRFFAEKELPIPTLYLMGEEDHLFLPPVRSIVSRHEFSELFVVADSGHVCNVEQPEIFNAQSLSFLSRISAGISGGVSGSVAGNATGDPALQLAPVPGRRP